MFRHLPVNVRLRIVKNHLGPASGWPMKARVQGKVPMLLGYSIAQAIASNGGVRLSLRSEDGNFHEHETEHVIAATGYNPDLRRLEFLDPAIRNEIRSMTNAPTLSAEVVRDIEAIDVRAEQEATKRDDAQDEAFDASAI